MSITTTHYDILGVQQQAEQGEIKQAFRRLAHQCHPDRSGGDDRQFRAITEAYRTLHDPDQRAAYDRSLTMLGAFIRDLRKLRNWGRLAIVVVVLLAVTALSIVSVAQAQVGTLNNLGNQYTAELAAFNAANQRLARIEGQMDWHQSAGDLAGYADLVETQHALVAEVAAKHDRVTALRARYDQAAARIAK